VNDKETWSHEEALVIARACNSDPKAVGQLYRMYVEDIKRYVSARVSDAQTAEDITADVFLRALESLEAFEYRGVPFSAWLYRIAHDRVADHYRRRSRDQESLGLEEDVACSAENPDQEILKTLEADRLRSALERLTEGQRLVIVLRFLERKSLAEAAEALEKSKGSIKALQHRALAALRRILGEPGQ
jgi:RNA polymerase sigma-70 factor (ECF subfamily)